jgi:hypothetical protein
MKFVIGLFAAVMIPIAAIVVAYDIAKVWVEDLVERIL